MAGIQVFLQTWTKYWDYSILDEIAEIFQYVSNNSKKWASLYNIKNSFEEKDTKRNKGWNWIQGIDELLLISAINF